MTTEAVDMAEKGKGSVDVVLRPRRQVTLPKEVCQQLGLSPGDMLELTVDGPVLTARPKKAVALEALREIRSAFQRSGITEEELQEAGRRVRKEVVRERYAAKG